MFYRINWEKLYAKYIFLIYLSAAEDKGGFIKKIYNENKVNPLRIYDGSVIWGYGWKLELLLRQQVTARGNEHAFLCANCQKKNTATNSLSLLIQVHKICGIFIFFWIYWENIWHIYYWWLYLNMRSSD